MKKKPKIRGTAGIYNYGKKLVLWEVFISFIVCLIVVDSQIKQGKIIT